MAEHNDEWFTCYNAKIVKFKHDGSIDLPIQKIDFLMKQIGWWNEQAKDAVNGYDAKMKKNKYIAPQTMTDMLKPYLKKEWPAYHSMK